MLRGKGNIAQPFNADSWSGDYAGNDGTEVEQSLGLTVGVGDKAQIGGQVSHKFRGHDGYSRDDKYNYGVYLGRKIPKLSAPEVLSTSIRAGKDNGFHGINFKVGAALILGVDINLRLGYYGK